MSTIYTTALQGSVNQKRLSPEPKFFWELKVIVGGNPKGEQIADLTPTDDYLVGEFPIGGTVFPFAFAVAPTVSTGFVADSRASVYSPDGGTLLLQGATSVPGTPLTIPAGAKLAIRPFLGWMEAYQPITFPIWI